MFGGTWYVGPSCTDLTALGYQCAVSQQVTVSGGEDAHAELTVRRAACAGDCNADGEVTVDDIIVAVGNALNGCNG